MYIIPYLFSLMWLLDERAHTDLRGQMLSPAGIHPLLDLLVRRTRLCWRSPNPGSGHNHGPTLEGWSPHWPECLDPTVQPVEELPATQTDWRRAEGTENHHPGARSTESWTRQQTRPDQTPGPSTRRHAHRLWAGYRSYDHWWLKLWWNIDYIYKSGWNKMWKNLISK